MQIRRHLDTPDATKAFAAWLGRALASGDGGFVAMYGDLGAGKTTFVQGLVAALPGGEDLYVTSPTYALAQTYETTPPVTHMDLYRLGSLDDLEAIGYRDLYFGGGITIVEWAERVPEALPERRVDVHLTTSADEGRELSLVVHGADLEQLLRKTDP